MKAELIKKEGNVVNFKLTIDNDKFEAAINKAYNKNKGRFKGKSSSSSRPIKCCRCNWRL